MPRERVLQQRLPVSGLVLGFSEPRLSPLHSKRPADRDTVFRQGGVGLAREYRRGEGGGEGGGGGGGGGGGQRITETMRLELKYQKQRDWIMELKH